MKSIKKHLESTTDPARIAEIEKIISRGTITFEEWKATGKFIKVEEYQTEQKLLKSCVEVIEFVGDVVIQILNTAEFYYNKERSNDLDVIEKKVWKSICEKLWCETC